MNERQFSSKFRAELKRYYGEDIHCVLLQDAPKSGVKPYDCYAVFRDEFYAIEFKYVKGASINPNIVSDRQIKALRAANRAGGYGYIIVGCERTRDAYFCSVNQWLKIRSTVKIEDLKNNGGGRGYDHGFIPRDRIFEGKDGTMYNFSEWLVYGPCEYE